MGDGAGMGVKVRPAVGIGIDVGGGTSVGVAVAVAPLPQAAKTNIATRAMPMATYLTRFISWFTFTSESEPTFSAADNNLSGAAAETHTARSGVFGVS